MKANEAPEKIYLDEDESWHLTNPNGNSIEYTRTDAFIEKAKKWFEEQTGSVDLEGNHHWDEEWFEDFKNAMRL